MNNSVSPGIKTENLKLKIENCDVGENVSTKYPSPTKLKIKTITSQNGLFFLCTIQV
jgi:hypothetical protein